MLDDDFANRLALAWETAWNAADVETILDLFAENATVLHSLMPLPGAAPGGRAQGRSAIADFIRAVLKGGPLRLSGVCVKAFHSAHNGSRLYLGYQLSGHGDRVAMLGLDQVGKIDRASEALAVFNDWMEKIMGMPGIRMEPDGMPAAAAKPEIDNVVMLRPRPPQAFHLDAALAQKLGHLWVRMWNEADFTPLESWLATEVSAPQLRDHEATLLQGKLAVLSALESQRDRSLERVTLQHSLPWINTVSVMCRTAKGDLQQARFCFDSQGRIDHLGVVMPEDRHPRNDASLRGEMGYGRIDAEELARAWQEFDGGSPDSALRALWAAVVDAAARQEIKESGGANPPRLHAPAAEEEIREYEQRYGVQLPEEYSASLRVCNGQDCVTWWWDAVAFESLREGRETWEQFMGFLQNDVRRGEKTGGFVVTGPVRNCKFDAKWIPVAADNGLPICLDLNPAPGGKVGQVIIIDLECFTLTVIADSFPDFLLRGLIKMRAQLQEK